MTDDAMMERVRKLLAKAEAAGTTPAERDALAEKAGELMIKYGIDEAVARATATGAVRLEPIIKHLVVVDDVPLSYSHEFASLGARIAPAFDVRAVLYMTKRRGVYFIGHESDVKLVTHLYASLVRQCTLNLAAWYAARKHQLVTGTERYNAKRGFITGFGTGVGEKLRAIRKQAVVDAGPGTEVALRDRAKSVDAWLDDNMNTHNVAGRRYDSYAVGGGYAAGQRADVGQTNVTNNTTGPRSIGGR